jgi:hypothetical protein
MRLGTRGLTDDRVYEVCVSEIRTICSSKDEAQNRRIRELIADDSTPLVIWPRTLTVDTRYPTIASKEYKS